MFRFRFRRTAPARAGSFAFRSRKTGHLDGLEAGIPPIGQLMVPYSTGALH